VHELSAFMQKRAHRASDAVVQEVLRLLPEALKGASGTGRAAEILRECQMIGEASRRPRQEKGSQPEARVEPRLSEEAAQALLGAVESPLFEPTLVEALASSELLEKLKPSKKQLHEALKSEYLVWCQDAVKQGVLAATNSRRAVDGFMQEVSAQSVQEMDRHLAEVKAEGDSKRFVAACRDSVRQTLRREVKSFEGDLESSTAASATDLKRGFASRLRRFTTSIHTELDRAEADLQVAGGLLEKVRADKRGGGQQR
ncbi:unnamed protein product, partial [Effrenium voratum]